MEKIAKTVGGIATGIGAGAGQTFLLRKKVDPEHQIKKLKKFGQISVLAGMAAGVPAMTLGIAGVVFDKGPLRRSGFMGPLAASYGASATSGAVLGLVYPIPAPEGAAAARARVGTGTQVGAGLKQIRVKTPREGTKAAKALATSVRTKAAKAPATHVRTKVAKAPATHVRTVQGKATPEVEFM